MLQKKVIVKDSKVHGLGLFANEKIRQGDVIWRTHPYTTQVFNKDEYIELCNELTFSALYDLLSYSYVKEGLIYYLNDNTRFINHSETPNIAFSSSESEMAIKDIQLGEEITENYLSSYDKQDFFQLQLDTYNSKEELFEAVCQILHNTQ